MASHSNLNCCHTGTSTNFVIKKALDSEKFTTTYKYISHIRIKTKPLKENWESEDDQENRPYGIVGINDGLIKHPVLAVEDN